MSKAFAKSKNHFSTAKICFGNLTNINIFRMQLFDILLDTDCGTYEIWSQAEKTDPAFRAACLYNQAYIRLMEKNGKDSPSLQRGLSVQTGLYPTNREKW